MGNHEIGQRMAAKGILVILFQDDFALRNPEHGIGQRMAAKGILGKK